jgi:hypothetical protein
MREFAELWAARTGVTLGSMSRRWRPLRWLVLLFVVSIRLAAAQDSPSATTAGQLYVPVTFPISVDPALYNNPFDPLDIEVLGVFDAPSGGEVVIPGFWMQPFEDPESRRADDLQPTGEPGGRALYAGTGDYAYAAGARQWGDSFHAARASER